MYKELYSIFYSNGFVDKEINKEGFEYIDEIKFFTPSKELKKQEYFIVMNLKKPKEEELDILLDKGFNEIYTEVVNSTYFNKYVSKNTTAIIFIELENLKSASDNSSLNKKILNIEESKYNFKKNIITYTEKQGEEFRELYSNKENVGHVINSIIYDKNKFVEFKKDPTLDSIYNLMSKLQMKIPFLALESEEKKMECLKENIDKQLKDSNYDKFINIITNMDEREMERFIEESLII
ncbi:MAG: hypothetical protein ACRDCB_14015 [Clostridium sp.]